VAVSSEPNPLPMGYKEVVPDMGAKNIYERFLWFDHQVRLKKYPNASSLPLCALPFIFPFWALLYLDLFGCNIVQYLKFNFSSLFLYFPFKALAFCIPCKICTL
jgi:hypothetical protein